MKEDLRGYAAGALYQARVQGDLAQVAGELGVLAGAVADHEDLAEALSDPGLDPAARQAVVADLLAQAQASTRRLVAHALSVERSADVPAAITGLATRAAQELDWAGQTGDAPGGPGRDDGPLPEAPAGRSATRARLEGFATSWFETMDERSSVEEVEDDLFRLARTVEANQSLREVLVDPDVPLAARRGIVADLVGGAGPAGGAGRARSAIGSLKAMAGRVGIGSGQDSARRATVALVSYAMGAARPRGLVDQLDWLVARAAAERGLRLADVRAAVDLDQDQQARLGLALSRITGRQVELRVTLDPSLIGGVLAVVGDTVVDGTVRRRLEEIRAELSSGSPPGAAAEPAHGPERPA